VIGKSNYGYNFLEKAGAVLDGLGSCEDSLEILRSLLDAASVLPKDDTAIHFKPIESLDPEHVTRISTAYSKEFTPEEQEVVNAPFAKNVIYPKPPEEFSEILGTRPYALNRSQGSVLKGGMQDYDEDAEIEITPEERSAVAPALGGLSLGAITLLYLTALERCGA
jgi:hypothetical protein